MAKEFDIKTYSSIGSIIHKVQSLDINEKEEIISLLEKAKSEIYDKAYSQDSQDKILHE